MTEIVLKHAKLSASGSKKWLTCTPSARLEEQFPDEESAFAQEGTFAHAVFEQEMLNALGRAVDPLPAELMHFDSQELRDHVMSAVTVAMGHVDDAYTRSADPLFLVEERLDFSPWVPEGWGTGDLVIVSDGVLSVLDLKYGKGIPVLAEDNSQMRLYALGAYNQLSHLYDIKTVRMTILQPRLDNYASEEMSIERLLAWADDVVVPRAKLAWDGAGEFVPGEHCTSGFCRARFQCAARAQHALTLAKADFALAPPELLTQEQLIKVLTIGDQVAKWISDVQAHALKQAEEGREIPGFKVVEGRSNRKYVNQDAVAERLVQAGVPEAVIYERSLLGITAMEKAIGKKKFAQLLDDLVEKPKGKPTLVPATDKREPMQLQSSAQEDFQ